MVKVNVTTNDGLLVDQVDPDLYDLGTDLGCQGLRLDVEDAVRRAKAQEEREARADRSGSFRLVRLDTREVVSSGPAVTLISTEELDVSCVVVPPGRDLHSVVDRVQSDLRRAKAEAPPAPDPVPCSDPGCVYHRETEDGLTLGDPPDPPDGKSWGERACRYGHFGCSHTPGGPCLNEESFREGGEA